MEFDMIKLYSVTLLLSFLTESGVEYIFGTAFDKVPAIKPYSWLLMYVSLAAGVGLSFYYQLDIISYLGGTAVSPVGMILTGTVVGRGANFLHGIFQTYVLKKPV